MIWMLAKLNLFWSLKHLDILFVVFLLRATILENGVFGKTLNTVYTDDLYFCRRADFEIMTYHMSYKTQTVNTFYRLVLTKGYTDLYSHGNDLALLLHMRKSWKFIIYFIEKSWCFHFHCARLYVIFLSFRFTP